MLQIHVGKYMHAVFISYDRITRLSVDEYMHHSTSYESNVPSDDIMLWNLNKNDANIETTVPNCRFV